MRKILFVLSLVSLPVLASAQTPEWAFQSTQETLPDDVLDSIRDADNAARAVAYPAVPISVPQIVREGKDGGVCMGCHLPSGLGQSQSAPLAGLPAAYFVRQIANFTSGARGDAYRPNMARFAQNMTLVETIEIAEYYASLRAEPWIEVRETDTVPQTIIGPREIRVRIPGGGDEPLGERIVELANSSSSAYETGSPAYVAYVPRGSIAQGAELVNRGVGKTIACGICHGENFLGRDDVPAIAGRSAIHNARQLIEFRDGSRGGASAAPMIAVVENLQDADIIAISAYLASLPAI